MLAQEQARIFGPCDRRSRATAAFAWTTAGSRAAARSRTAGFMQVTWFALTHQALKQPGQQFWDVARTRFSDAEVDAAKSVGPILSIYQARFNRYLGKVPQQ